MTAGFKNVGVVAVYVCLMFNVGDGVLHGASPNVPSTHIHVQAENTQALITAEPTVSGRAGQLAVGGNGLAILSMAGNLSSAENGHASS